MRTETMCEEVEGVPQAMNPVWWDRRHSVLHNQKTIEAWMAAYKHFLPAGVSFDEAAIMLPPGENYLDEFSGVLGNGGWVQFNQAHDLVYANPFGTRYAVQYTFFRKPGKDYRLEVMQMSSAQDGQTGFSPLHQSLWPNGRTPLVGDMVNLPIPHLSFKPWGPLEADLAQMRRAGVSALQYVRDQGAILAQACQSTYGHFWYCIPTTAQRQLYVKPRVNLRESGETTPVKPFPNPPRDGRGFIRPEDRK